MTGHLARLGAATFACGLAMASGAALAQSTKPAPAAPAPAAPAAPGAPAAGQPAAPIRLELQPMQSPWTKLCGKDPTGREVCYTTRDFGQAADQPPTIAIAIYQITGEERRIARFLMPFGLMLKPGFRVFIDKGEPIAGQFAICFPNGCFAETELNNTTIAAMKKAQTVTVQARNQTNAEVNFVLPMKDFATSFDGPAVDPKVIEQQNQELQKQLEEKGRLQRELLEKQNAQTPAAPAAPAAPKQ